MAWLAFEENSWRIKLGGLGVVTGIDTVPVARELARAGIPDAIADRLAAACEAGFLSALHEKDGVDGQGT